MMNVQEEITALLRRVAALEARHNGTLTSLAPNIRRRESRELIAADAALVAAETAYEKAKEIAYRSVNGGVMVSREYQEHSDEFADLEKAEKAVVKARVARAKLAMQLDVQALNGESFMSAVARTVGLK